MKVISYSLFGDPMSFEYPFYLRGIYFNVRMNRLLYPDWQTVIIAEHKINNPYQGVLDWLKNYIDNFYAIKVEKDMPLRRCEGMLWRMLPIYFKDKWECSHVICRDADAITTYREAICVNEWLGSDLPFHGINDNPAHGGLMGGMVGFRVADFKRATGYTSFEQMISGLDLSQHGSDQNFMMKSIHPKIKNNLLMHVLSGGGCEARHKVTSINERKDIDINPKLWESSNTCRFIGSPGVVDFELLRFFKRFDNDPKFDRFEKQFSDIFYWQK